MMENTTHYQNASGQDDVSRKNDSTESNYFKKHLVCINSVGPDSGLTNSFEHVEFLSVNELITKIEKVNPSNVPDAVIFVTDYTDGIFFENLSSINHVIMMSGHVIPLIVVSDPLEPEAKKKILKSGADDCFTKDLNYESLNYWIDFLKIFKKLSREENTYHVSSFNYSVAPVKRLFDVLISATALFFLSPVMLIVALIIKLESKGPVFYISKRAGAGYKVFNFMKFRSMSTGADKELSKLLHLNQYGGSGSVEVKDKNSKSNPVFFKIKDDPRITRFGKFLRDTSLDELPQLINVLRGDMSIVGNRPLPLYEAQQLTRDQSAMRFMAAAGITGLWQVTKRGKAEMSEDERISLDVEYARSNSFKYDIGLILKTFPALLQEERV